MNNTKRPQKAFGAGQRRGSAKPWAGTGVQGSKDELAYWQQRRQHYVGLAESPGNADRFERENYWQHAEHFYRLIAEAAGSHRPAGAAPARVVP